MRKKYLSALLFGALLFASAGTFTSCKDYDDDINNLQEQINTVKTDLENLKATVEGLDGVKTLSYADGMLIIETGKGTKVEVPVPSATGVTTVELKDNVLYVDGKEAGKVEIAEGEAVKVEVKEDGKLYINGEVQNLEIGSKVVMVDNGDGSYTMTVDGTSYVLPKYSPAAAITSVEFETAMTTFQNVAYETIEDGISWNLAATDVDWKGPKGPVKRNELLVGQATTVNVQVTPASFDMTTPGLLSLKDSKGNVAPVKVTAVANNKLITTSRSTNASGSWLLSIEMNDEIDATNILDAFVAKNGELKNYALCVAGTPVSAYDITIKTRDKVNSSVHDLEDLYGDKLSYVDEDGLDAFVSENDKLPIGTTALTVNFKDYNGFVGLAYADHLYDSYITFEGSNQSLAKARGIVANGMSITAPASAAGTVITATIHMMDITGKVFEAEQKFTVASSVANAVEADAVKYVVMPAKVKADVAEVIKPIEFVNLEKVFAQIPAETLQKVTSWDQLSIVEEGKAGFLVTSDKDNVLASGSELATKFNFLKADGTEWTTADDKDDLIDLATIKLPFDAASTNTIAADAKPGTYTLYLVAKSKATADTDAQEIFRVKMDVEIALPDFDQLFTQAEANWADGKYQVRITPNDDGDALLNMASAYNPVAGTNAETSRLSYVLSDDDCVYFSGLQNAYNGEELNTIVNALGTAELKKNKVYAEHNTKLVLTELQNVTAYTSVFAGMSDTKYNFETVVGTQTSDVIKAIQEAFTVVSPSYNTVVKTALQDITAGYYKAGVSVGANQIKVNTDGTIKGFPVKDGKPDTAATSEGFGFELEGTYVTAAWTNDKKDHANEFGQHCLLGGYALFQSNSSAKAKDVIVSVEAEQTGVSVAFTETADVTNYYVVSGLTDGQSTTLTFKLTDKSGFVYSLPVTVVK